MGGRRQPGLARVLPRAVETPPGCVTLTRAEIEAETPGLHHTLTGEIRLYRAFPSRVLGRARDVLVYLPPGYDAQTGRRYPVLYVNDGQNVFDGATSYVPGQEWQLDETAERLIRSGELPPLIIVAIFHAGERRLDEFGPTRDRRRRAGGSADLYGRMLFQELKPFIDRTYRTRLARPIPGWQGRRWVASAPCTWGSRSRTCSAAWP